MSRKDWKALGHVLNALAAFITLKTCPRNQRTAWCAIHAGFSAGIELMDAAADKGWLS